MRNSQALLLNPSGWVRKTIPIVKATAPCIPGESIKSSVFGKCCSMNIKAIMLKTVSFYLWYVQLGSASYSALMGIPSRWHRKISAESPFWEPANYYYYIINFFKSWLMNIIAIRKANLGQWVKDSSLKIEWSNKQDFPLSSFSAMMTLTCVDIFSSSWENGIPQINLFIYGDDFFITPRGYHVLKRAQVIAVRWTYYGNLLLILARFWSCFERNFFRKSHGSY